MGMVGGVKKPGQKRKEEKKRTCLSARDCGRKDLNIALMLAYR
jgi:hypothetical protein